MEQHNKCQIIPFRKSEKAQFKHNIEAKNCAIIAFELVEQEKFKEALEKLSLAVDINLSNLNFYITKASVYYELSKHHK